MEDLLLNRYLAPNEGLTAWRASSGAGAARWMWCSGIGGLAYAIATAATPPTAAAIAISVGGILLAYQALTTVVLGFKSLVSAQLAWQEVKTLFQAAGRAGTPPTQASAQSASSAQIGLRGDHVPLRTGWPGPCSTSVRWRSHPRRGCCWKAYRAGKSTLVRRLGGAASARVGSAPLRHVISGCWG
ncbi:MAG: hypothetical protein R3A10_06270 [Caldilineaceae bacterium]